MRQRIVLFAVLVAIVAVLLAAGSAQATTYVRGFVRPSGNGDNCNSVDPTTTNCVGGAGSVLECGQNGSFCPFGDYNLFKVGVTQGETVDFTFGSAPGPSDFQVVVCGYGNLGNLSPGIYTSSDGPLQLPCTALGDPNDPSAFMDPANFINDLTGTSNCPANTLCYQFSGAGLPSTWVFDEISTGPTLLSITGGTVTAPEPASMTLLAAGLVGLGALRRKRAA